MRCGECAHPLSFLVQLYCPLDHEDDAFHRCLYVFCCPKVRRRVTTALLMGASCTVRPFTINIAVPDEYRSIGRMLSIVPSASDQNRVTSLRYQPMAISAAGDTMLTRFHLYNSCCEHRLPRAHPLYARLRLCCQRGVYAGDLCSTKLLLIHLVPLCCGMSSTPAGTTEVLYWRQSPVAAMSSSMPACPQGILFRELQRQGAALPASQGKPVLSL